MKAEVDKLGMNELTNVLTSLNYLKTKVDDLDVTKLKNVSVYLKNLSDLIDNEVDKNTKLNTLKTKVNNLEKKITEATTLIHINQYNTDKKIEKKLKMLMKKYQAQLVYWLQLFWIEKLVKLGTKYQILIV